MSAGTATFVSSRRKALLSRGWRAGLAVGLFSALLFTFVGNRLQVHGYTPPGLEQIWNSTAQDPQVAGQWTTQLLIALSRLLPGSSINTLTVMTIIGASFVQGFIAHDLVRRGWQPALAALAVGLTGLHPVILYLATNGSPTLIYAIAASLTITALDRLEAIGDTRSLIVMGLSVALLFLTWPNAIFFALPLALLLPLAFRAGRSVQSLAAMYLIIAAPSLIALSAVAIGGELFALSWARTIASWSSPLHGNSLEVVAQSSWLRAFGGKPMLAFLQSLALCAVIMPRGWVILIRLLIRPTERRQPATGLAALLLPPLAGALATWFWQTSSAWSMLATSMLCCSAWATTVRFRRVEQRLWLLFILCGVVAGWTTPLLWGAPDLETWRRLVLAPLPLH
ncbi:hypothetical protein [Acidocella sp.]|uniref:hypothetical protein n=1 Tax=Acidocella sp. TaxID=50710 RepID=UPI003CFD3D04